jgi:hypothetical protein
MPEFSIIPKAASTSHGVVTRRSRCFITWHHLMWQCLVGMCFEVADRSFIILPTTGIVTIRREKGGLCTPRGAGERRRSISADIRSKVMRHTHSKCRISLQPGISFSKERLMQAPDLPRPAKQCGESSIGAAFGCSIELTVTNCNYDPPVHQSLQYRRDIWVCTEFHLRRASEVELSI